MVAEGDGPRLGADVGAQAVAPDAAPHVVDLNAVIQMLTTQGPPRSHEMAGKLAEDEKVLMKAWEATKIDAPRDEDIAVDNQIYLLPTDGTPFMRSLKSCIDTGKFDCRGGGDQAEVHANDQE